jgi:hypothetical protein
LISIAPTAVFVLALVFGALKGRYALTVAALAAWGACVGVAQITLDTVMAGDVPFGDAWLVVLLQVVALGPAVVAATSGAAEDSVWAESGRPAWPSPIADTLANFIWVFAIVLLGILFDGAGIIGGEIFCGAFALLLAAVLLFGLGSPRAQTA